MRIKLSSIFFVCFCLFVLSRTVSAYYNPGKSAGFVNDYANILTIEQKQQLENKLSQFEKVSSGEIAVVLIRDLQGDTIENFSVKLFKDWGIGKKEKDNGVLILVAKDNRKMRIEVGYGLEGALTDAQSSWIINYTMKPAFRSNDFYKGLNDATDQVIAAIKGENIYNLKNNKTDYSDVNLFVIFGVGLWCFMLLYSVLSISKSWWLGGLLGAIAGVAIGLIKGFFYIGLLSIAILLPAGLLLDFIASKYYRTGKGRGRMIGGGRWGGGGGGSGGFGGGGSGGGGSSGGW